MKKSILFSLSLLLMALLTNAQRKNVVELNLTSQPSPYIHIRLMYDKYRLIGDQQYTTKITNLTNGKISVKGTLVAVTLCGNEKTSNFDITINPGETIGGNAYLSDSTGCTGEVFDEDCNNPQKIYTRSDNPSFYEQNRIKTVMIRGLFVKTL